MIGVFDSGVGGFCSLRELCRLMPRADITYLADRENAPYGTKTKEELIEFIGKDISTLKSLGARKILIACCTASAVYPFLGEEEKKISFPIIEPSSVAAARLGQRITVIATEYTVSSHAFSKAISKASKECRVAEISAQELVSLAEKEVHGERHNTEDTLEAVISRIKKTAPEVLILGCTHFSHLEKELSERLSGVITVSPAVLGARALYEELLKTGEINEENSGDGRLRYL